MIMITKTNNSQKNRCISVGLTSAEYSKIELQYKASICRNRSEYIRNLIWNRPVTILYRNQSLDDLIEEIVILNRETNTLKSDLSTTLERLYRLKDETKFKESLQGTEIKIASLHKKMDEVKNQIEKIVDKWLQS
jgi:predicted  nucleic acid-binding Zn-ribbon protein